MSEQKSSEEQKYTFIADLYLENLKLINNVVFTSREIDVLACILHNRASKKIAAFLLISPRTVENHIRNIMLKLDCNSRECIIDFIDHSDKDHLLKTHYSNLLLRAEFRTKLKKFSSLTVNRNIKLQIFYQKTQKKKDNIHDNLIQDLSLAGFQASIIDLDYNTTIQNVNLNINQSYKSTTKNIVILPNKKSIIDPSFSSLGSIFFYLTEHNNYYSLVWDILLNLLPKENINKFEKHFKSPVSSLNSQPLLKDYDLNIYDKSKNEVINVANFHQLIKIVPFKLFVFFILLICFTCIIFSTHKELNITKKCNNHTQNNTQKIMMFNLPPRNLNFTGRNLVLEQITSQLNNQKTGVITQTIAGLGGVGKTQLATEFAYIAAEKDDYAAIFWIPAETSNAIYSTYKELASYLQLDVSGLELASIQTLVHNKVAAIYKNHKILIILDNVPDHDYINDYLTKIHKELSPSLSSYVLITSRAQYWPTTPVILDIFTSQEALEFVQKHLPDEKTNDIEKLTSTLHFFPLALGQAVTYIKKHTNINDYLELYSTKQKTFLDTFPGNKNQYNETLWKTWDITLSKLSNTATELLFVAAYLDPDNIPLTFFEQFTTEERTDGIGELRKYSFITMINNNQSFKIHRLLQEVIRLSIKHNSNNKNKLSSQNNIIKNESYWLTKAIDLLNTKFDYSYLQTKQWTYWSKYLSHAQSIANYAITLPTFLQYGLELYVKIAMFLTYIQIDENNAIIQWNKIIQLVQLHYRPIISKFVIAKINSNIGNALNNLGKFNQTIKLLQDSVLPVYQQQLPNMQKQEHELFNLLEITPPKHAINNSVNRMNTLNSSLIILGNAQYKTGFVQKSLLSYNMALKVLKTKSLNNEIKYDINDTLWAIGRSYISLGQFVKAEATLKRAKQELSQLKLYAQHPRKLSIAYDRMALLMYHIGKFDYAMQFLNKCSTLRIACYSPNHIQHIDTYLATGFTNYMLGNFLFAIHNFNKIVNTYKLYGTKNDLIYLFTNLGFWKTYEALGKYNKAIKYIQITLKLTKSHSTNNITSAISFQLSEAEIWPKLTNQQNILYWQSALQTTQQLFGKNHYQSARYHYMLGQALEQSHKQQNANHHYKQALTIINTQEIRHPNLKQFYIKNTQAIQTGIARTSVSG